VHFIKLGPLAVERSLTIFCQQTFLTKPANISERCSIYSIKAGISDDENYGSYCVINA
jgi:hypothetical protein